MNRNYKVIWNQSLNCFMAVAEYAKSRGKSSSSVSSTSTASAAISSGARLLRLSALSVGLISAGFSVQAVAGYEAGGGTTRANCTRGTTGSGTESASIAIANENSIACASGPEAIAIGANLAASGSQATAIGSDIIASGDLSVIIGQNFNSNPTTSTGAGGVAIGSGLTPALDSPVANGVGSVAIGSSGNGTTNSLNGAVASGNHALALMSGANASATNSIALGTSATANNANSVALGSGSTTAAYVRTQTGTVNGKTYTYAGTPATSSTVSIGASGTERTLTNLAAGRVSATSTDGINGSQLFQTNTELGNLAASTASALGGSSAAGTAAGAVSLPTYNVGGTTVNNVGDALTNLDGRTTANTSGLADLASGKTGLVRQDTGTGAITVGAQTGGTSVEFTGTDGVRTLSGLANGNVAANSTEAVTGDQLNTTNTNVTTAQTTASSALTKANQGFNISADNGTQDNVQLGEAVNFTNTDGNLVSTVSDNGINYDLAENISVTQATIGDATNNTVLTSTANGLDVGGDKITNLSNGTIAAGSSDAVTGDQLNTTNTSVTANRTDIDTNTGNIADNSNRSTGNLAALGGGAAYDAATDIYTAPTYTLNNGNNDGSTTDYNDVGSALGNLDGRTTANTSGLADLASGKTGLVRQDTGTGAITVGAQTGGTSVEFTNVDGANRQLTGVASAGDITLAANANNAVNAGDVNTAVTGLTNAGLKFSGDNNTATPFTRKLGEELKVRGGATELTDNNIGVVASTDDTLTVKLSENIDLGANGSVTTGNSVTNSDGVKVDDGAGNATTITTAGTSVTDGTSTSNYGAEGFTVTDATGNRSIFNQSGISFTDTQGDVTGPSITASGINAGGSTITNLKDGTNAGDAVNKRQLDAITGNITAGGVQYNRNPDNTVNYDQVSFAGTPAIVGKDDNDNDIVVSGGTTLTNVANGINASDAVNKGQLDSVTKVKVFDKNGDEVTVNLADQVVNNNVNNNDLESLFLTYNKEGQEVTDRLTIGETVQKMNTEGVKFAHTNASSQSKGDIANGVTNDSSAGGLDSTAIGVNAIIEAGADSTVALGHDTFASADATKSVVIGKGSEVAGESSIAIGDGAQALGNQSISIGTGNVVNGDNSGAFGDPSIINGSNSYSVGNNNTINSNDTFVFGNNVTQTVEGSVVLGTGSAAMTGAGIAGFGAVSNAAIAATTSTTGAVAVGDAANNVYRQVTGVAAGTADSDAVNVSQLKAVSDALGDSNEALSNAAVQYDKNPDDTVNKGSITLGGAAGTTITNVKGGSIAAGSTDAINGGQLHNLGSDVAGIIGGDATYDADGNLTANNIGGTGKGNISDAIASINQGNAQANEDIKVNTDNIQANTDRLDAGLSFGADNGDNFNKPVGDGTALKFEGSDNITTTTTGSGIKFDLNGNISVDSVTADSVTTGNTTVSNNGITIKDGPSMTTEGINAGNKTITGVADGIEVNDAVNLGQLNALDGKLSNSVNELGYKINEVEDDANAGVSAAMAMSSLPQAYIPGKSMVGGGIATYNGQSAVAIGVSKVSDNGRWVIKVNGTADTQGNAGGAVGAGFHF
nr:YadA-like family protein [Psychrobacter submarinus]